MIKTKIFLFIKLLKPTIDTLFRGYSTIIGLRCSYAFNYVFIICNIAPSDTCSKKQCIKSIKLSS